MAVYTTNPTAVSYNFRLLDLLFFLKFTYSTAHPGCDNGQFACQTDCIAIGWVCDGEQDCFDGRDEENCTSMKYARHRPSVVAQCMYGTTMQWYLETCKSCCHVFRLLQICLKDADQDNISAKVAFVFQMTGGVMERETVFMQMMKTDVIMVGHYSLLSLYCIPYPL